MLITETHKNDILGTLYCYDRVIINGTAGSFGYADGMTTFLIFISIRYLILQIYLRQLQNKLKQTQKKLQKIMELKLSIYEKREHSVKTIKLTKL